MPQCPKPLREFKSVCRFAFGLPVCLPLLSVRVFLLSAIETSALNVFSDFLHILSNLFFKTFVRNTVEPFHLLYMFSMGVRPLNRFVEPSGVTIHRVSDVSSQACTEIVPSAAPTSLPTAMPFPNPSAAPLPNPTSAPTGSPQPSAAPSQTPTSDPTTSLKPSQLPTDVPSHPPSMLPIPQPSESSVGQFYLLY